MGISGIIFSANGYFADWIYMEASVYRNTHQGITRPLGAGTDPDTITDGAVPYWRFEVMTR